MSPDSGAVVVVALVRDLMDRSRFGALAGSGVDVGFVDSAEDLAAALTEAAGALVVVDLGRDDALDGIVAATSGGARVVAYGSHVDRGRLDAAHAAGAEVLARSAFFARLPDLLSS
jgi:beta-phosphoglucomutase-like phosphatase (HAD superfamily)